jgi:hypothetical protein
VEKGEGGKCRVLSLLERGRGPSLVSLATPLTQTALLQDTAWAGLPSGHIILPVESVQWGCLITVPRLQPQELNFQHTDSFSCCADTLWEQGRQAHGGMGQSRCKLLPAEGDAASLEPVPEPSHLTLLPRSWTFCVLFQVTRNHPCNPQFRKDNSGHLEKGPVSG